MKKFGAIDIGSNAVRLLIVRKLKEEDAYKTLEYLRVPLRLGDDTFSIQRISEKNEKNLTKLMQSFKILLELYEVDNYRACATSALREADNADDIVESIYQVTGIPIDLISGEEEANLVFYANQKNLNVKEKVLFVDVGGGSVEISLFYHGQKVHSKSFKIGTVRVFNGNDNQQIWTQMEYWLKKFIKPYQPSYILGTGGNINKVADYFQKSKYISHTKLTDFYKTIKEVSVEDRIEKYKMNQDRAEVIVPALEIFHFIMVQSGAEKVRPSTLGLKEGIVLDWLKKN